MATNYIWLGDNILMEKDDTGQTQARYTYNPKPHGELISQRRWDGTAWQTRYHRYDALGSTRALTDETGSETDSYTYDAWGNEIAPTSTFPNPFRWVGKYGYYWDAELGTHDIRRRPYQPTIGRWLSEDPLGIGFFFRNRLRDVNMPGMFEIRAQIEYEGGDEWNLYEYVRNNPTRLMDPPGLLPFGIDVYERNGQICGYSVWLLTGWWCANPNTALAATGGYEKYITCWWDCEVGIHKCVCTYAADLAGAACVTTFTHLEIAKGAVRQGLGTPGDVTTAQSALALWLAQQGYKGYAQQLLRRGAQQVSGNIIRSGIKSSVAGIAVVEAGFSIYCGWKCTH